MLAYLQQHSPFYRQLFTASHAIDISAITNLDRPGNTYQLPPKKTCSSATMIFYVYPGTGLLNTLLPPAPWAAR